jgi:hypothetical protein
VLRLNVTLDDEHAERLNQLAERTHVRPGTIARSLLSIALEDIDIDPHNVVALLDGIPGAHDRALGGRKQAVIGETIPLSEIS